MARGTNLDRIARLQAAKKRAKAGAKLSLTELATLYGISKGGFVNVRNKIADFPEPEQGNGNELLYDAKKAIAALLTYETRTDDAEKARQELAQKIIAPGKRKASKDEVFLPPSEMLKLSRLVAEIEEREREQGQYIHISQVTATATRIYGILGEALGQLETRVDPNGLLSPELRSKIAELGREAQLSIHRELSDTLGVDADHNPSRAKKPTRKAGKAKRTRTRRKPS